MSASAARDSRPSLGEEESVPLSLVRVRAKPARRFEVERGDEAFRSTMADPALTIAGASELPADLDRRLEAGLGAAIVATRAHVALLHRRGEAFFYTIGVRGLDRGMHMMVWVSMWDPAIQMMLRGRTLLGSSQLSAEHATVARRLHGTSDPRSIVAVPVMARTCVEAVLELGRFGKGFAPGSDRVALEAMQQCLA